MDELNPTSPENNCPSSCSNKKRTEDVYNGSLSSDWEYAKHGIALWLNNDPDGAEIHFKAKKDKIKIFAGYAFTSVLNAVISYEMDKIETAQIMLKELENLCTPDNGWIRSFRTKFFGSSSENNETKPLSDELEEKIILADCLMCSAILTFLTQDISGLMRGSWLLRKAWKIYQQSYEQIYEIYTIVTSKGKEEVNSDENNLGNSDRLTAQPKNAPVTPVNIDLCPVSPEEENLCKSSSSSISDGTRSKLIRSKTSYLSNLSSHNSSNVNFRPKTRINTATNGIIQQYRKTWHNFSNNTHHNANTNNNNHNNSYHNPGMNDIKEGPSKNVLPQLQRSLSSKFRLDRLLSNSNNEEITNANKPNENTTNNSDNHYSDCFKNKEEVHEDSIVPKVATSRINLEKQPSRNNLHLDLKFTTKSGDSMRNGFKTEVPLSCPEPVPSPLSNNIPQFSLSDMDIHLVRRLMGAVSFGYGVFQLSVSLLPPSLMRLISFFGFEGNKNIGLACLNYAKSTEDMRAPFATLALLWYYTIGAQLFHMDGNNMQEEIAAAKQILKEYQNGYATSAIFLFFRGRLKRLQCNIDTAIQFYDAAYRMSAQKELKLLCLHEVGWCRLVQLDFGNAMLHFHELKLASNFSKTFYTYMSTICQGAFGRFDNIIKLKADMLEAINKSGHKESQIDKFIIRRVDKLPSTKEELDKLNERYFKFFIYEMLFLWNTLYSCTEDVLNSIMSDCSESDETLQEPSIGLAKLILGSCFINKKDFPSAMHTFQQCIQQREAITEDIHLSAFAHYELAMLLIKYPEIYSNNQEVNESNDEDMNPAKQEAKAILNQAQRQFRNYDFESRLSARIYLALKSLQ